MIPSLTALRALTRTFFEKYHVQTSVFAHVRLEELEAFALQVQSLDAAGEGETPQSELSDTQKMFVLLAEIRRCIHDDQLMEAQRKVYAIEAILKASTPLPGAEAQGARETQHAVGHWFTQGGEAQYGDIGQPLNADELIAAILRRVRLASPAGTWQPMADAAEMLWVVLANVSGGDWTKQTPEWQEAAARWRDNYFAALKGMPLPAAPDQEKAKT